jgi:hypothetical protein
MIWCGDVPALANAARDMLQRRRQYHIRSLPMEPEVENNAIARARADLADFDRRIAVTKAEEDRLATERQRMEMERGKVVSFIEMYEKYAGHASPSAEGGDEAQVRTHTPKPNGAHHAAPTPKIDSRKRRAAPLHRKPPGTPTTHDMILAALRDAESRGLPGLAPKDIGTFIKQKWWPHLKGSSIGPAAWRMYKDKEIRREGEVYAPLAS